MTTDELKDLIASKIAGQGSAVDAGSALPEILGGVVDLLKNQQDIITELQTGPLVLNISSDTIGDYPSAEKLAEALQVSEKDLADLFEGKIPLVSLPGDGFLNTSVRKDVAGESADSYAEVYFWYVDGNTGNLVPGRYILTKQTNPQTGIYIVTEK